MMTKQRLEFLFAALNEYEAECSDEVLPHVTAVKRAVRTAADNRGPHTLERG